MKYILFFTVGILFVISTITLMEYLTITLKFDVHGFVSSLLVGYLGVRLIELLEQKFDK